MPRDRSVSAGALEILGKRDVKLMFSDDTELLCSDVHKDVVKITAGDRVTIVGGQFRHVKPRDAGVCQGVVFSVEGGSGVRLMRADINGCGSIGVRGQMTSNLTVYRCHIHRNTFNAFYLQSCGRVTIASNLIEHNGNTLQAYKSAEVVMVGNRIVDNSGFNNTEKTLEINLRRILTGQAEK